MSKKIHRSPASPVWTSQNFLTSRRLIDRLIGKTSIGLEDRVLEIGPGKGHLTRTLLTVCGHLTAVEVDPRLMAGLRARFAGCSRLTLVQGDFLKTTLPRKGDYKVFSSIPFNRTTAIIRKLTETANPPVEAWLAVERGAALRYLGQPRESLSSLLLKPKFEARIVHRFRREDFHPAPSVDAVMLYLKRKAVPDVSPRHWKAYEGFLSRCFVKGELRSCLTKRQIVLALKPWTPEDSRSGTLKYVQWLCLFRCWMGFGSKR